MTKLTQLPPQPGDAKPIEPGEDQTAPAIGRWFWFTQKEKGKMVRRLVCVTEIGSNYAEVTGVRGADGGQYYSSSDEHPGGSSWRLHLDEWTVCTTREFEADVIIQGEIERGQKAVAKLLDEVKQLTARLFVSIDPKLGTAAPETGAALVTMQNAADPKEYGKALVKAKEKTIPALFEQIRAHHTQMAHWMKAQLIPFKAEAEQLKPVIETIERRIFHVELYAGLTENIEQVREGKPAAAHEKVKLLQRRHYMDEECLLQYEAGGMDFKKIGDFDKWLAKPANLDRLMPHPRCVLAFQVRRRAKDYTSEFGGDWQALVQFHIGGEAAARREANKWTFLYMRNGEQLFRLDTQIEFGEELFPDVSQSVLQAKEPLYATRDGDEIITESDYLQRKAQRELKTCADCAAAKREKRGHKQECDPDATCDEHRWYHFEGEKPSWRHFEKVDADNVHFDDVMKALKKQADDFNRVVLVLQGVFDRSPTFNPHPPYKLYGPEFPMAVELIFDNARALPGGEMPDIEAYFTAKNQTLKAGDVTVGQHAAWWAKQAALSERERWSDRHSNDNGPGALARVLRLTGKGDDRKAHFAWTREASYATQRRYRELGLTAPDIVTRLAVPVSELFNVSAYKPGEFKRFFADPRTRADYLKWAWALLMGEDFAAGKAEIQEPPAEVLKPRKAASNDDAQRQRERRRSLNLYHGKLVRLAHDITTTGQETGEKGLLCRAYRQRGKLRVVEVYLKVVAAKDNEGQAREKHSANYEGFRCRGLEPRDVEPANDVKDAAEDAAEDDT